MTQFAYNSAKIAVRRECGDCNLCCKVIRIENVPDLPRSSTPDQPLEKPAGEWCWNCTISKGCAVYDDRPSGCSSFECSWLTGEIDESMKPNKIRAVFWIRVLDDYVKCDIEGAGNWYKPGDTVLCLATDDRLRAMSSPKVLALIQWWTRTKKAPVAFVCGGKEEWIA